VKSTVRSLRRSKAPKSKSVELSTCEGALRKDTNVDSEVAQLEDSGETEDTNGVNSATQNSFFPSDLPFQSWSGAQGNQSWAVINADALEALTVLKTEVADCIVTSPPYFWQRDYGSSRQSGHEATVEEYVGGLVAVFREAKRVLRKSGLLFLVLGDTYYSGRGQPQGRDPKQVRRAFSRNKLRAVDDSGLGFPRKSLIGIPWRVALALQSEGWRLRSAIVWQKPRALAEPNVRDRPWGSSEFVFMLARSEKYFFDRAGLGGDEDVWNIPAPRSQRAYPHAALFPEALVERCLACGCPPGGTVLDPYVGSGTTMLVALRRGRSAIGIDINESYCEMSLQRVTTPG
jgi:site-specific DNA-methyltransferase (adenine-specific)